MPSRQPGGGRGRTAAVAPRARPPVQRLLAGAPHPGRAHREPALHRGAPTAWILPADGAVPGPAYTLASSSSSHHQESDGAIPRANTLSALQAVRMKRSSSTRDVLPDEAFMRLRGTLFFGPAFQVTRNKLTFRDNLQQLLAESSPGEAADTMPLHSSSADSAAVCSGHAEQCAWQLLALSGSSGSPPGMGSDLLSVQEWHR